MVDGKEGDRTLAARFTDEAAAELRSTLERAVRKVCPRWPSHRREDLVQIATMRAMEARPPGEGVPGVAASYLYRVAYTTLIDEIRRLRRRPEVPLDEHQGDGQSLAASAPGPEQAYAAKQIGGAIQDCLRALVRDRRLAVTLHLQGHTVPEVASLLGWSAKRTENLAYRGLTDLRRCLDSKGVVP